MFNDIIGKSKKIKKKNGAPSYKIYLGLVTDNKKLTEQIDKLAKYLLKNEFHADYKLTNNQGSAVDLAIRLLKLYTNRTE